MMKGSPACRDLGGDVSREAVGVEIQDAVASYHRAYSQDLLPRKLVLQCGSVSRRTGEVARRHREGGLLASSTTGPAISASITWRSGRSGPTALALETRGSIGLEYGGEG
jgi:hypothetical protein